jgi:hypothetical protein
MPIEISHDARSSIASIVFAADFSSGSRNAGLYAAAIARHFDAELIIIHAFILSQSAREAESLGRTDSAANSKSSYGQRPHFWLHMEQASALNYWLASLQRESPHSLMRSLTRFWSWALTAAGASSGISSALWLPASL